MSIKQHTGSIRTLVRRQYRLLRRSEFLVYLFLVLLLGTIVFVPIMLMVRGSFGTTRPGQMTEFTLATWQGIFGQHWFQSALKNSVIVSTGGMIGGVSLGVALSWILVRTNTPYVDRLEILVLIPFFLSPFVMALAWKLLASEDIGLFNAPFEALLGISPFAVNSLWGIIWVFTLYYCPFAYLIVGATMRNMNTEMEEAARMSGASSLEVLRTITFPIMAPSILAACLLIFVAAAGQFGAPMVLGQPQGLFVLPTRIFMEVRRFPLDFNTAAALGVMLMVFAIVLLYIRSRILGNRSYVTVGGESSGTREMDLGKWRWVTFAFVVAYIVIAVAFPIGIILVASFMGYFTPSPDASIFTLANWQWIIFDYPITATAVTNSVLLATIASLVAMVFCVLISWVNIRTDIPGRQVLDGLGTVPIAVPGIVMGLAYMFTGLRSPIPIYGTIFILGIAYMTRFLPYGLRSTSSTLRQIDDSLEEAARMSGATLLQTYRQVTFPLLKPGIASGYIILYVIFIRELSMSILLYSPDSVVLSVVMFDLWNDGLFVELATIATMQLALTGLGLVLLSRFFGINISGAVTRTRGGN